MIESYASTMRNYDSDLRLFDIRVFSREVLNAPLNDGEVIIYTRPKIIKGSME